MDFFDVVFPVNMGPLTYHWLASRGRICPGMIVTAEVKKSAQYGVVLGRASGHPGGPSKELLDVVFDRPVMSEALIGLLRWMADYYLVPEGIVLKSMVPLEYFKIGKTKRQTRARPVDTMPPPGLALPSISPDVVAQLRTSLSRGSYMTYLLNAPTLSHEIAYSLEVAGGIGNVIILVPEITDIGRLSPFLRELVGDRLTILHGRLSREERRRAMERIFSGASDIVLGTRLAVFAPLRSVSLLCVLQEHDRSYKSPEGVRYHARDVAVMRGYLEKATVMLSSPTPSMESFFNTVKKKYILLTPPERVERPRIEVINLKTAKKVTPYLSRRAVQAAKVCVEGQGRVLFFLNRRGYSLIQCAECSDIRSCPECGIPLIYHKSKGLLECHYCTLTERPSNTCRRCSGTRLETIGAGTQRITAEITKHLHVEPLRIDTDSIRDEPRLRRLADVAAGEKIVVGTKALTGRLGGGDAYKLCVFLNPDIGLHLPDFRSAEILFQEIVGISECVLSDGLIIIQTKMPGNDVFRYLKSYSFTDFLKEELSRRKSLSYPPLSRIIVITVTSKDDARNALEKALPPEDDKIEVIGPLDLSGKTARAYKMILKSQARERLRHYAKEFLMNLKREKGMRVIADVDPISL